MFGPGLGAFLCLRLTFRVPRLWRQVLCLGSNISTLNGCWTPFVFRRLCAVFYVPGIDLFASRLNALVATSVSWNPAPAATFVNAFLISLAARPSYAFPPFSLIARVLRKLQEDRASLIAILPLWPSQAWFPRALQFLVQPPVLLPRLPVSLPQNPTFVHPRARSLVLTAMSLSGDPLKSRVYRETLPSFCLTPGGRALYNSIGRISQDGCQFVSGGKLIHFYHL